MQVSSIESFGSEGLARIVSVFRGSIVTLQTDAIVNAANHTLLGGGGVDGAIHQAAGPQLYKECKTLHGCRTGEAKMTLGYNLPAKHVIHTVGPCLDWGEKPSEVENQQLRDCYVNCMNIFCDQQFKSIAFPCISTGVWNFPIAPACDIAVDAVFSTLKRRFQKEADAKQEEVVTTILRSVDRVIFCAFRPEEAVCLASSIQNYLSTH